MVDKSWFLQFLGRNPGLSQKLKSGFWMQPEGGLKEKTIDWHSFKLHNPKDQLIGDLHTSWAPVEPNKIFVDSVMANLPGKHTLEGTPFSVGHPGTRDFGRQLLGYYKEQYPGENINQIGGFRVSGARAKMMDKQDEFFRDAARNLTPESQAYHDLMDQAYGRTHKLGMGTTFKPAIVGGPLGALGAYEGINNDWSQASLPLRDTAEKAYPTGGRVKDWSYGHRGPQDVENDLGPSPYGRKRVESGRLSPWHMLSPPRNNRERSIDDMKRDMHHPFHGMHTRRLQSGGSVGYGRSVSEAAQDLHYSDDYGQIDESGGKPPFDWFRRMELFKKHGMPPKALPGPHSNEEVNRNIGEWFFNRNELGNLPSAPVLRPPSGRWPQEPPPRNLLPEFREPPVSYGMEYKTPKEPQKLLPRPDAQILGPMFGRSYLPRLLEPYAQGGMPTLPMDPYATPGQPDKWYKAKEIGKQWGNTASDIYDALSDKAGQIAKDLLRKGYQEGGEVTPPYRNIEEARQHDAELSRKISELANPELTNMRARAGYSRFWLPPEEPAPPPPDPQHTYLNDPFTAKKSEVFNRDQEGNPFDGGNPYKVRAHEFLTEKFGRPPNTNEIGKYADYIKQEKGDLKEGEWRNRPDYDPESIHDILSKDGLPLATPSYRGRAEPTDPYEKEKYIKGLPYYVGSRYGMPMRPDVQFNTPGAQAKEDALRSQGLASGLYYGAQANPVGLAAGLIPSAIDAGAHAKQVYKDLSEGEFSGAGNQSLRALGSAAEVALPGYARLGLPIKRGIPAHLPFAERPGPTGFWHEWQPYQPRSPLPTDESRWVIHPASREQLGDNVLAKDGRQVSHIYEKSGDGDPKVIGAVTTKLAGAPWLGRQRGVKIEQFQLYGNTQVTKEMLKALENQILNQYTLAHGIHPGFASVLDKNMQVVASPIRVPGKIVPRTQAPDVSSGAYQNPDWAAYAQPRTEARFTPLLPGRTAESEVYSKGAWPRAETAADRINRRLQESKRRIPLEELFESIPSGGASAPRVGGSSVGVSQPTQKEFYNVGREYGMTAEQMQALWEREMGRPKANGGRIGYADGGRVIQTFQPFWDVDG